MPEYASSKRSPSLHASSKPTVHLDDLWDFAQPVASALRFANAAQDAARVGDINCELEALTQQARGLAMAGERDWAHSILDTVDPRLRFTSSCRPAVRLRLERGRAFNDAEQAALAKPLFVRAWELARDGGEDGLAVEAGRLVATASAAEPDVALAWNLSALELAEGSHQPDAWYWLDSLYGDVGWAYFRKGNLVRALDVFERAVVYRQQAGVGATLLTAKWCVARTLRAMNRTTEALAAQQRLLAEYEAAGIAPPGSVYEELGECTLLLGLPDHAAFFRRAHALLSQDSACVQQEPARLQRLRHLGFGQPVA